MRPLRLCAILPFVTRGCTAASVSAADSSAVLQSTGIVVLNGAGAPATRDFFRGHRPHDWRSVLTISSSPGSTVLLPQNSQLTYKGNSVSLANGKATVTTTKGMSVKRATTT